MYFKNLQPYRLSTEWPITLDALREQLATKPFKPCGSQDHESRGWVPPFDGGELKRESDLVDQAKEVA